MKKNYNMDQAILIADLEQPWQTDELIQVRTGKSVPIFLSSACSFSQSSFPRLGLDRKASRGYRSVSMKSLKNETS